MRYCFAMNQGKMSCHVMSCHVMSGQGRAGQGRSFHGRSPVFRTHHCQQRFVSFLCHECSEAEGSVSSQSNSQDEVTIKMS
jgi:hypothetical protein